MQSAYHTWVKCQPSWHMIILSFRRSWPLYPIFVGDLLVLICYFFFAMIKYASLWLFYLSWLCRFCANPSNFHFTFILPLLVQMQAAFSHFLNFMQWLIYAKNCVAIFKSMCFVQSSTNYYSAIDEETLARI